MKKSSGKYIPKPGQFAGTRIGKDGITANLAHPGL